MWLQNGGRKKHIFLLILQVIRLRLRKIKCFGVRWTCVELWPWYLPLAELALSKSIYSLQKGNNPNVPLCRFLHRFSAMVHIKLLKRSKDSVHVTTVSHGAVITSLLHRSHEMSVCFWKSKMVLYQQFQMDQCCLFSASWETDWDFEDNCFLTFVHSESLSHSLSIQQMTVKGKSYKWCKMCRTYPFPWTLNYWQYHLITDSCF